MLKLAGCACILLASSGMAYSCALSLRQKQRQAELLQDLLAAIEGEVTYSRCPLPELLWGISAQMPAPYCGILAQVSRSMEDSREADIAALWKSACGQSRAQLALPKEAYQILLRIGEVFAYSSLESSLKLLQLSQKKLAGLTETLAAESAGKRKLYCCLCYTAGLFSILILL